MVLSLHWCYEVSIHIVGMRLLVGSYTSKRSLRYMYVPDPELLYFQADLLRRRGCGG